MNVSLKPLTPDEFNRLLKTVLPPECKVGNIIATLDKRELTGCQRATLSLAVWDCYRYYTDKDYRATVLQQAFIKATDDRGWGWKGNSFAKEKI